VLIGKDVEGSSQVLVWGVALASVGLHHWKLAGLVASVLRVASEISWHKAQVGTHNCNVWY